MQTGGFAIGAAEVWDVPSVSYVYLCCKQATTRLRCQTTASSDALLINLTEIHVGVMWRHLTSESDSRQWYHQLHMDFVYSLASVSNHDFRLGSVTSSTCHTVARNSLAGTSSWAVRCQAFDLTRLSWQAAQTAGNNLAVVSRLVTYAVTTPPSAWRDVVQPTWGIPTSRAGESRDTTTLHSVPRPRVTPGPQQDVRTVAAYSWFLTLQVWVGNQTVESSRNNIGTMACVSYQRTAASY